MKANKGKEIQKLFFNCIRHALPGHISLVHEIAELLEISYDSAYRRLRAEKELTIDEMKILANHFNISTDSIFGDSSDDILFKPFALSVEADGFADWLKVRLLEVKKLEQAKEKEIIMVARDLPIYYYFNFPELISFKMYFWKKMFLHHPDYHNRQFNISEVPSEELEVGMKLLNLYNTIPTVEIWCRETFTRILQQIEFCRISGFFMNKNDPDILYEKIELLYRHIHYQTELGCKFNFQNQPPTDGDENFKVVFNDLLLIDNTIFVKRDDLSTVYVTHNSYDIMQTDNVAFCCQVEQALRTIIKTGSLISGTSALECNRFFNSIFEKLNDVRMQSIPYRSMV